MTLRAAVLTAFLIASFCHICRSYPQAGTGTTGSLVNQAAPSLDAIQAQSAQDYQIQQAEALAAARAKALKAAYLEAIAQAKWDDAVKKLTDARDHVLAQLANEEENKASELTSKEDALRYRFQALTNEMADAAHQQALENYQPTDPWRMLDGKVSYAKGHGWVEFVGEILEVQKTGILVHGSFGPPLEANYGERDYFVADFPHKVADGERIISELRFNAYFSANTIYTLTNNNRINGGVHTIRGLEYGTVVTNPPPDLAGSQGSLVLHIGGSRSDFSKQLADIIQQMSDVGDEMARLDGELQQKSASVSAECEAKIIQLREAFEKQKKDEVLAKAKAVQDKTLKYNREQADKGDPVGLLRMGERYRDGEGVPKDLSKAREYLQKAADAGSPSAADELKALPAEDARR